MLICFAPGSPCIDGTYHEVHDGMYLGGQTRMEAFLTFAAHAKEPLAVVGSGGQPKAMSEFLSPLNRPIQEIVSLSCTMHNIEAILSDVARDAALTFFSSQYHLPRIRAFWEERDERPIVYVAAEQVLERKPWLSFPQAYHKRIVAEQEAS